MSDVINRGIMSMSRPPVPGPAGAAMNGYISVNGKLEFSDRKHTWVDSQGDVWSILDLGGSTVVLGSADEARKIANHLLEIASDVEAKQAEVQQ